MIPIRTSTRSHTQDAVEVKHKHREDKVAANKRSRINLLKNILKYDEVEVFTSSEEWNAYKAQAVRTISADKLDAFLLSGIKMQLNCLR